MTVPRRFTVEGKACGIPRDNHLWIVVQTGAGLSAKDPELLLAREGHFARKIVEPNDIPAGFSVVLLLVSPRGHRQIEEWLAEGRARGSFPPLRSISGSTPLDTVPGLDLREAAPPRMTRGRISSPMDGERVASSPSGFTAGGTISEVPRGRHAWLAVEVNNLLFPKEPEIRDRNWTVEVFEQADRFSLVLLMVDPRQHRKIEEWFRRGERGGGFPGLALPGSVRLDVASDVRLRSPPG